MTTFAGWENFYVIVGSSAGALIGLQQWCCCCTSSAFITPGTPSRITSLSTEDNTNLSGVVEHVIDNKKQYSHCAAVVNGIHGILLEMSRNGGIAGRRNC